MIPESELIHDLKIFKANLKNLFPEWTGTKLFLLKNGQWMGLFSALLMAYLLYRLIRFVLSFYTKAYSENSQRYEATLPFGILGAALFFHFCIYFLEFDHELYDILFRGTYILSALSGVFSALKIVDYGSYRFEKKAGLTKNKFDDVLVPLLKKTAKVIVAGIGALFIAHSLTFDIAGLVAGLGIGGVAVALAAKDTISNIFGSVTVILDRPFSIGDYIILEKGVEGTVEQVGFRSTRLRTPSNSLVTMPNSLLANISIDNYGLRHFRRFKLMIGLEFSNDGEVVQLFIDDLNQSLKNFSLVQEGSYAPTIALSDIHNGQLQLFFNVFLKVENAKEEALLRHHLIQNIMVHAKKYSVQFSTLPVA